MPIKPRKPAVPTEQQQQQEIRPKLGAQVNNSTCIQVPRTHRRQVFHPYILAGNHDPPRRLLVAPRRVSVAPGPMQAKHRIFVGGSQEGHLWMGSFVGRAGHKAWRVHVSYNVVQLCVYRW